MELKGVLFFVIVFSQSPGNKVNCSRIQYQIVVDAIGVVSQYPGIDKRNIHVQVISVAADGSNYLK